MSQLLLCAQAVFWYRLMLFEQHTTGTQKQRALTLNMYLPFDTVSVASMYVCLFFCYSYFKQRRKIDELRKRQKKMIKGKPIRNFCCMDNRKRVKRTLETIFFDHFVLCLNHRQVMDSKNK